MGHVADTDRFYAEMLAERRLEHRWAAERALRYARLYGAARGELAIAHNEDALRRLDGLQRDLFPEERETERHEGIEPIEQWGRGGEE